MPSSIDASRSLALCPTCGKVLDEEGEANQKVRIEHYVVPPPELNFPGALLRILKESLAGFGATLLVGLLLFGAFLSQDLPLLGEFSYPGLIFSSFLCTYLLFERTRAARMNISDVNFDLVETGNIFFRAFMFFPLLAGLSVGHQASYITAVVLWPVLPLILGALSNADWRELTPFALFEAWRHTPRYGRSAFLCGTFLYATAFALGSLKSDIAWRVPVAAFGATLAGVTAGLARRDAESIPES